MYILSIFWLPILTVLLLKRGLLKYGSFQLTVDGQIQYFWLSRQMNKHLAEIIAYLVNPWPVSGAQKFELIAAGMGKVCQPQVWGTWQIPEKLYKKAKPLASHQNIIKVTS